MNVHQLKRYNGINSGINTKTIQLNDSHKSFTIKMSCATGNFHTVTINKQNKTITCSCIDMEKWAKKFNCICKHCCYVLFKLLPFYYRKNDNKIYYKINEIQQEALFMNTLKFNDSEYNFIESQIKCYNTQKSNNYKINILLMIITMIAIYLFTQYW